MHVCGAVYCTCFLEIFAPTEEDFNAAWDSWIAQSEGLGMNELAVWMGEQLDAYNATMAG